MKILAIGSGGREHAIVWKLKQSPRVSRVFCAPGNGGIARDATVVPIGVGELDRLVAFAVAEGIDLVVVGPEAPLVDGLADQLRAAGVTTFGPSAAASRLEGSKIFAKEVMTRAGVPTAGYEAFDDADSALRWVAEQPADKPWVVKADGLAAGKGVLICDNRAEAEAAVRQVMVDREFGAAGDRLLVEERLSGYEVSQLAICAGQAFIPLEAAQDYKRIGEGDTGPNTGGMGCYSPVPSYPAELRQFAIERVIAPVLREVEFIGVLYAGLMITPDGPSVLEFNARFGDPETQVVLPRLESDLAELLLAAAEGRLEGVTAQWSPRKAVSVVLAAGGYPGNYPKGDTIHGLDAAGAIPDVTVFHAGTAERDGDIVTNGGRVLNVTALGDTFGQAIDSAYEAAGLISWSGMQYRRDIGARVRE